MSMPGYDAWKTRLPDDDGRECPTCGEWMIYSAHHRWWLCEHCEERNGPDPDQLYDEWREREDAREGRLPRDHVAWQPPVAGDEDDAVPF